MAVVASNGDACSGVVAELVANIDRGLTTQAVLGDATESGAEILLRSLAELCVRDPEAHCLLLCQRKTLHGSLWQTAAAERFAPGSSMEEALRRVHIKYVEPASSGAESRTESGLPPLSTLLVSLQCLDFTPRAIGVLGLQRLVATAAAAAAVGSSGPAAGGVLTDGADPAAVPLPQWRSPWRGGIVADLQQFALAVGLFLDAAASVSSGYPSSGRGAAAILWDDAASIGRSRRELLGCSFDAVWNATTHADGRLELSGLGSGAVDEDAEAGCEANDEEVLLHGAVLPRPMWECM
eukprot:TRINITY_DN66380_c0_g1_i1.p1 TRINITY_DN66380_c0_g1~~TRINITY_DN66380_c0_g1_i1.p1  ORF type:complete len:295 (+),score=78.73 TRINITY_DN66380_c0_g1_i1:26-910(+)